MTKLAILILAAGASSRTAPNDKLEQNYQGVSLLRHCCQNYIDAEVGDVHLILGGPHTQTRRALIADLPLEQHLFFHEEFGMGWSIAYGVSLLKNHYNAIMIALADMPKVATPLIKALAAAQISNRSIVVPQYEGRFGQPVIFGSAYFEALSRLKSDKGARGIIENHLSAIVTVRDFHGGSQFDIDELL